jgi:carbon starvation protein
MVANTFNGYSKTGALLEPNAAAASISLLYMFVAVLFGLYLKYFKPTAGLQLVIGIVLMIAMLAVGIEFPVFATAETWRYVVFAYLFAAAVMPMWLLKQPRDYLSMFLLIGMILCAVIGVCIRNPTLNMPAVVGFEVKNLDMFPILFVTIACGAVSGFHSLVSSGTSSKMVSSEGDIRLVGYGSMCVECVLGVVAMIVVCAAATNNTLPSGTPFAIFSSSVAGFLTNIFGIPQHISACILTMCVSALALTSVDAVARIGRMSLQELFTPAPGAAKTPVQKFFTNTCVATVITLLCGYALCMAGYMSVWPLFGSANQLLSALVLTALAVYLKSTGKKSWMLYGPMTFMFVVTMTALLQSVYKIFLAWQNGTFTFLVQGLQLIVAVALIVLALLVVIHCVAKLRDPETKTEPEAAA